MTIADPAQQPMNPDAHDNPTRGRGIPGRVPFGDRNPRPLKAFNAGQRILTAQSAPATFLECGFLDPAARAEFVVRCPAGVTAYTIHYGRWVSAPDWQSTDGSGEPDPIELDGWLEVGTLAVASVSGGSLSRVLFETFGDRVGIYVTDITGTATESFAFWLRGAPAA